jgi:hypothetical protein
VQEWISTTSLIVEFALSDEIAADSSSFVVVGCDLEIQARFAILSNCTEGTNSVTLPAQSFIDSWGNPGPIEAKTISFTVDTTAPSASWSDVVVTGTGPFSYSATLSFREQVAISTTAVSFSSTVDCETGNDGFRFWASCDFGTVGWSLNLAELTDQAGNSSSGVVQVTGDNPRPVAAPVAIPQPVPDPTPVVDPQPNPEPVTQPVVTEPAPIQLPISESPVSAEEPSQSEEVEPATGSEEIEMIPEPMQGGMVVVELPPRTSVPIDQEPAVESAQPEPTAAVEVSEELSEPEPLGSVQIEAVAGPEIELNQPAQAPWLLLGAIGFALLLGLGFWRFSGR